MKKSLPRAIYAITGVLVLLFAGLVYAWSTLSKPLMNLWSQDVLTWTSTIVMVFFCLGGFFGGQLQKRGFSIKLNLVLSAILMICGFLISGLVGNSTGSIIIVFLGFGLLAGLGAGLAYNAVLSAVSGWFPDKQGLISGILLMGFGISAFLMGLLYASMVDQMDGKGGIPWYICFLAFGIGCFLFLLLGGLILKKPGLDFVAPASKNGKKRNAASSAYEELPPSQRVKRVSFWLMFAWAVLTSIAGLGIVFLGTPIATAAVPTLNDSASLLAIIVGLISIFNGIGRIIFGGLFDKIGYKATLVIVCGLFIISIGVIILALVTGSQLILIISYILTGLSFGGVTPSQSAFVNTFYGSRYYAQNLPIITMNLLIASFGTKLVQAVQSSLMAGGMTNSGAYIIVLAGVAVICVIAGIIALFIRKPNTEQIGNTL